SPAQEEVLLDKINMYAQRGTLLTPKAVRQMAELLHGENLGQVKEIYDSHTYFPHNIYNMDEVGFDIAIQHCIRTMWLEDIFDPATKGIARDGQDRRLLFLDGLDAHVQLDFLDTCWVRNIVHIILPAHMSGEFQPLDVKFFGPLKDSYNWYLQKYLLGNTSPGIAKGVFY
ncbi:hypothetical protein TREMEDRAFT_17450, partial [Tremella mesenterica DSM 1558]|uniref:uncharacterized protein n=1 Tax=Tremella mesenterica (strain ATCC 24925 / CBS 8224 / DSM 1558 / NBRC 9311 / NRRL Y-6157 / RJB 2259-6 / UBC 559-6) TaxID=578456 RepID=UPI0003F48C4C